MIIGAAAGLQVQQDGRLTATLGRGQEDGMTLLVRLHVRLQFSTVEIECMSVFAVNIV